MKFFCYLLIVVTLSLSVIPCCTVDECCDARHTTCAANDHHSEEAPATCSPFMVCGSCIGLLALPAFTELNPEQVVSENNRIPYIQAYPEKHNMKFWQPPKVS